MMTFRNKKKTPSQWNRTRIAISRLSSEEKIEWKKNNQTGKLEPYFKGRRVIQRNTPVNKGVYPGAGAREAIVVDRKYGEINKLADEAIKRATVNGKFDKTRALKIVYDIIREKMPVKSEEEVQKILKKYEIKPDEKIALDIFIKEGVGVCRHQALATAAVLEALKEKKLITGKISVDRNTMPIELNGKKYNYGHAWVRYTNSAGEVFIIDPVNGKLKRLKEANEKDWDYKRPKE